MLGNWWMSTHTPYGSIKLSSLKLKKKGISKVKGIIIRYNGQSKQNRQQWSFPLLSQKYIWYSWLKVFFWKEMQLVMYIILTTQHDLPFSGRSLSAVFLPSYKEWGWTQAQNLTESAGYSPKQPQWPRLKLLLVLLHISLPWILSHKVRLTENGIHFLKSTKSDVRQKMFILLWLISFISQGRLTNIRNQNIYLARSWQTIQINSYCTVQ